jgi:hypothetical protein
MKIWRAALLSTLAGLGVNVQVVNAQTSLKATVYGEEIAFPAGVAYSGSQHTSSNVVTFTDDGKTATLNGNIWLAYKLPQAITVDSETYLKFRFEKAVDAEVNAICLDENNRLDGNRRRCFTLGGTQDVTNDNNFKNILAPTNVGGATDYEIRVAHYFTSTSINYIALVQDNDANKQAGTSTFKNIEIESGPKFKADIYGETVLATFTKYATNQRNQDTPSNIYDVTDGGNAITLNGNIWRAFPVDFEINKNTFLSFDVEITEEAEVNAICLDEDLAYKSPARCIAFGGTQDVSADPNFVMLPKYVEEGQTATIVFRPAEFFQTQVNYIAFMQDRDDNKSLGESTISNLKFFEAESSTSCIGTADFSFTLDECTYDNVLAKLQEAYNSRGTCANSFMVDLILFFDSSVREGIDKLCKSAYDIDAIAFGEVTREGEQFDTEYFDGGTTLNYERKLVVNSVEEGVLKQDGSRIDYIYDNFAQNTPISWPEAFNLQGCELRAAMCCFVADRQANDNNGNCNTNDCADADPGDNTDLCYTDMSRSQRAAHVRDGYSIYGDGVEGGLHCHGLAWGDNSGVEDALKGNNLFYVSMYDHLYTRGYVEQVQGAPMCGCVEKMPVVTRADCTELDVDQTVTITYTAATTNLYATVQITEIDFNACQGADNNNNDLSAYYQQLVNDGKASQTEKDKLDEYLVGSGNCDAAIASFLDAKSLKKA